MTQDNGTSGYTRDQIAFTGSTTAPEVDFTRNWYSDDQCSKSMNKQTTEIRYADFGAPVQVMKMPGDTFETYEANWKHSKSDVVPELGAIAVDVTYDSAHNAQQVKTVRIARGFGTMRNTMVSLFNYLPTPK